MEQAKHVAGGFVMAASAICLFVTFVKMTVYWNFAVGLVLFVVLAVPFIGACFFRVKAFHEKQPIQIRVKQAKNLLMGVQGIGLACWFFDIVSTVFNVNINQNGTEMNPLGWPYSAPAALAYYIPIAFVAYFLLFKVKSKASFYGAVVVSFVSLFMASRNFLASMANFVGLNSVSAVADLEILAIWTAITITLTGVNMKTVFDTRKQATIS
jgi:hypothetical protein